MFPFVFPPSGDSCTVRTDKVEGKTHLVNVNLSSFKVKIIFMLADFEIVDCISISTSGIDVIERML